MSAGTRIVVTADGKDTILADWTDTVIDAPDIEPTHEVQEVRYLRADSVTYIDRGHEQVQFTFVVMRLWSALENARIWMLDARRLTPRTGDVKITVRGYNTNSVGRFARSAAIMVRPLRNKGKTTFTQFTIRAGKVVVS